MYQKIIDILSKFCTDTLYFWHSQTNRNTLMIQDDYVEEHTNFTAGKVVE